MPLIREDSFPPPNEVPDDAILAQLQGNILRGFGRSRSRLVLLRFGNDVEANRKWVRDNVMGRVTTAAAQGHGDVRVLRNFLVTRSGLERLGWTKHEEFDPAFLRGMRADETRLKLSDPPPETWAADFRSPWDCVVLLAFDGELQAAELPGLVKGDGSPLVDWHVEDGNTLDVNGAPLGAGAGPRYEPFGFRDDVSSVAFSDEHEKAMGMSKWDVRRSISVALAQDPLASSTTAYGSYFVFRKLAQDVAGFRGRLDVIVEELRLRGPRLNLLFGGKPTQAYGIFAPRAGVAAGTLPTRDEIEVFVRGQIIGRAADGTPAVAGGVGNSTNDFDYSDDPDGRKCPFGAHARKCNPRGLTGDLEAEKARSFPRRGMPFGRADDQMDPKVGCGLLFLCAQSNISEQYEFVQSAWANDNRYVRKLESVPTPDRDNLIAQDSRTGGTETYGGANGDIRYNPETRFDRLTHTMEFDFRMYQFVTLQGGEYLFAPSITGIEKLVAQQGDAT